MIHVTEPFLPPKEDYDKYLNEIWERNWLTNNGPLVNELELQLKQFLDLNHLLYVTNGTIAIQLAIKALGIKGEVITTPFSYVATTSSMVWEGCEPVFVDIDRESFNIDPDLIENAITDRTTAILATHVFGNPCAVETIEAIAKRNKLYVIYDAAHCFGVNVGDQSIFSFGDISTSSFHATKLFHTIEGGAVITRDADILKRLFYLRNFGHDGPDKFNGIGINGKNSEFHAAMGLANLPHISKIIEKRKKDYEHYLDQLDELPLQFQKLKEGITYNYSYFPIVLPTEDILSKVTDELNQHRIFPRRYFYPLLSTLGYVKNSRFEVAESISNRILCLPMAFQLKTSEIDMVCRCIKRATKYRI